MCTAPRIKFPSTDRTAGKAGIFFIGEKGSAVSANYGLSFKTFLRFEWMGFHFVVAFIAGI